MQFPLVVALLLSPVCVRPGLGRGRPAVFDAGLCMVVTFREVLGEMTVDGCSLLRREAFVRDLLELASALYFDSLWRPTCLRVRAAAVSIDAAPWLHLLLGSPAVLAILFERARVIGSQAPLE